MTIDFSKKLYSLKAIKKSIEAYNELAKFSIDKNKNKIKVKVTNIDKELNEELLKNEFCNYVLSEIKNKQ